MTLFVNGEKIEESEIKREFERLSPHYEQVFKDQDPKQQESQLLDWSKENVIEMVLIKQEAKKHGEPIPEAELESVLAKIKEQYADQEQFYKDFETKDDGKIKETLEMQIKVERRLEEGPQRYTRAFETRCIAILRGQQGTAKIPRTNQGRPYRKTHKLADR